MTDYLTTAQAAERLGISAVGVRRMIERGDLKTTRFGRAHMIDAADLAAMPRKKPGPAPKPANQVKPASLKRRALRAP